MLAPQFTLPIPQAFVTIGLGALVAADSPLALLLVACFAIVLGLMHGIAYGSELPKTFSPVQTTMAGVAVALFVSVSLFAGQAASVRARWARTVVRVVGSWIAAIGLLMLGWAIRTPAQEFCWICLGGARI